MEASSLARCERIGNVECDVVLMNGSQPVGERKPVDLTLVVSGNEVSLEFDRHVILEAHGPQQVTGYGFYDRDILLWWVALAVDPGDTVTLAPTPLWRTPAAAT